jgi:hypothetical protein
MPASEMLRYGDSKRALREKRFQLNIGVAMD